MKKMLLLLFGMAIYTYAMGDNYTALFLGNSYTNANNLPSLVVNLAAAGGDTLTVDSNTPGGYTLEGHSTNTTSLAKIASQNWDFVILQEQSQKPAFPVGQVELETYPYAQILHDSVKANFYCSDVLYYMTWGRENGDASNCGFYPPICTYEGMQQRLRESYLYMGEFIGDGTAPVGAAWKYVRDSFPGIDLYTADESHPSARGSYLAACVFYTSIFKKSPIGLDYYYTLDSTTATTLQQVAAYVVLDSLGTWFLDEPIAGFTQTVVNDSTIEFTNTTANTASILWDFGDGNTSTSSTVTHSYYESTGGFNTYCDTAANEECCYTSFEVSLSVTDSCGLILVMLDTAENVLTGCRTLSTVGIADATTTSIKIYPNPAVNQLYIKGVFTGTVQVQLWSLDGKLMLEQQYVGEALDISALPVGIYYLLLEAEGQSATQKVLVGR